MGVSEYNGELPAGTILAYQVKDILLSNIRPCLKKIWFADKSGGCSADVLVLRTTNKYSAAFLYYQLRRQQYFEYVMEDVSGVKMPRGKKARILDYPVLNLPISEQNSKATEIAKYDSAISNLQDQLAGLVDKKQAVLKKYL